MLHAQATTIMWPATWTETVKPESTLSKETEGGVPDNSEFKWAGGRAGRAVGAKIQTRSFYEKVSPIQQASRSPSESASSCRQLGVCTRGNVNA